MRSAEHRFETRQDQAACQGNRRGGGGGGGVYGVQDAKPSTRLTCVSEGWRGDHGLSEAIGVMRGVAWLGSSQAIMVYGVGDKRGSTCHQFTLD